MGIYNKEFGIFSPYLLNKKLKPSKKIDGKYVYFYPNDKKKRGYDIICVSKEEWEVLVEQDRLEYRNNRRHDERKVDLQKFYLDDNDEANKIMLEKDEWRGLENFICESLDKGKLVHGFDDTDFSICLL